VIDTGRAVESSPLAMTTSLPLAKVRGRELKIFGAELGHPGFVDGRNGWGVWSFCAIS